MAAGQSVPHVHVHIIPRLKEDGEGDGIYERLEGEDGNVGGGLWDLRKRPEVRGSFGKIEEGERRNRSEEEMRREASFFRGLMEGSD